MKLRTRLTTREPAGQPEPQAPAEEPVSAAARNLAMAYKIEQWIEQGLIEDYGHAARMLGVSQVRLTHLMSLRLLAPSIQQSILSGQCETPDKQLRELARTVDWRAQLSWSEQMR